MQELSQVVNTQVKRSRCVLCVNYNCMVPAAAPRAPSPAPAAPAMDLLGLDDLLGGASLAPAPTAQPQQPPPPPPLQLRPQPQLSPQVFQQKWGTLTNMTKFQHSLTSSAMALVEANKHQVRCLRLCRSSVSSSMACTAMQFPHFLCIKVCCLSCRAVC